MPNMSRNILEPLIVADNFLLWSILGAHSKSKTSMLYLETSSLMIHHIMSCRRLIYLHEILSRPISEVLRRVYEASKSDIIKGDYIHLVRKDFDWIGVQFSEENIVKMPKEAYIKFIKQKVRKAALEELKNLQENSSKVKNIPYEELKKPQAYLTSSSFSNEECSILFNLRAKCINGIRTHFKNM